MDQKLSFIIGNESILDEIKLLWKELNQYHLEKSTNFKDHYKTFTFQTKKEKLNSHAKNGSLFIIIAKIKNEKIGYCIATIKKKT